METTIPNGENTQQSLTLKVLQNHFMKALIGALTVGIVTAFFTSYAFFYKTTDSINELNDSKIETRQDIKDLKKDVSEIKLTLSNTGIYTDNNKEEITQLKNDVYEIRKSQTEMMKLLYDIKSKQK